MVDNDRAPGRGWRSGGDRGSGTVLSLALVLVIATLIGGIALLARAQSGRGAAQSAADLGAIAAAERLAAAPTGWEASNAGVGADPCGIAREVVSANGSILTACELVGGGVVRVDVAHSGGLGTARASARAGPVTGRRG